LRAGYAATAVAAVVLAPAILALRPQSQLPFERLVQPGYSIAVMSPAESPGGIIYQGFGDGRYVLRTSSKAYAFEGHAFHPAAAANGGAVVFELVSQGHSSIASLDPESGAATQLIGPALDPREPAVSSGGRRVAFMSQGILWVHDASGTRSLGAAGSDPSFSADGSRIFFAGEGRIFSIALNPGDTGIRQEFAVAGAGLAHPVMSPDASRLAFSGAKRGRRQIWWRALPSGAPVQLTSADCNSDSPVWEADSRHLIFTSDCGRGLGLPGLYRADVAAESASRDRLHH
jgi:Tol biopolymer transport system component